MRVHLIYIGMLLTLSVSALYVCNKHKRELERKEFEIKDLQERNKWLRAEYDKTRSYRYWKEYGGKGDD